MNPTTKPFVISRTFNTSRENMWQAWTDCERFKQWFGPKGVTMPTASMDFRPGGTFHYCMRTPDGKDMWGKFVYRDIVAPEKITLVSSFSNAAGRVTRHPMSSTWPLEMHSTFTMTEKDGRTTATIEWFPINATPEEVKTFEGAHDGMKQGWAGTFDQLDAYLTKKN